jgi:hypothetical protein
MQWLITIAIVRASLALVMFKFWRFWLEFSGLRSSDRSDQEASGGTKPSCYGCSGSGTSESDLGILIKPLVQLGDKSKRSVVSMCFLHAALGGVVYGQEIRPPNYDESIASKYKLESVLAGPQGQLIESKDQWPAHRQYLLDLFADQEYGYAPQASVEVRFEVLDDGLAVLGGELKSGIRRRQIAVYLERNGKQVRIDLLVWSPSDGPKAPCFLGLNFRGNQSTCDDPKVRLTSSWCDSRNPGVVENRATEESRANQSERWPIARILEGGFAVATAHYSDIDPDYDDGFENGVHDLFPEHRSDSEHPNRWGSIAAWAWGLSRLADVLEKLEGIDPKGLMVVGHSRLGKTALWAGATDERFGLVVSNNSGCGGAALSQRVYGESVARINTSFPHWFNRNFRKYNDREDQMLFDQHQLIAAIAPRPVYIASASNDKWADPLGELLSGHYASSAYRLHGKQGLDAQVLPAVNTPIGDGAIGYHLRQGEHDLLEYDWQQFMVFARRNGF